jgi:hypothetical protein
VIPTCYDSFYRHYKAYQLVFTKDYRIVKMARNLTVEQPAPFPPLEEVFLPESASESEPAEGAPVNVDMQPEASAAE